MAMSPENTARLLALQRKAIENTATMDELREGIQLLRQDRVAAQASSTASKTAKAAAKVVVDPQTFLNQLKALPKA